ncbi:MAG TPA: hypothetical protein VGC93_10455, partial [Thermoanaerobaculia bacterium]
MDYRRLLVAFLLSMAVYLGWMALFPPPPPPGTGGQPDAGEAAPAAPAEPQPATQPPAATTGVETTAAPAEAAAPEGAPSQEPAEPLPPVAAAREERVVVETDAFRAIFTNRGAQLLSLVLKEHRGP